jgi:hypothetical protein
MKHPDVVYWVRVSQNVVTQNFTQLGVTSPCPINQVFHEPQPLVRGQRIKAFSQTQSHVEELKVLALLRWAFL